MEFDFDNSFFKDEKKIPEKTLIQLYHLLEKIKISENITDVPGIKKMVGYKYCYRIRLGDFRIGVYLEENKIIFSRILPRKDIYKKFP